ncbi:hypothetical protein GIB67_017722 [Kingdonia uniflora]|uniref:Protein kinase domain-containing protein n=1 Tax=Kingdonia uniflora TaxID=39325 RepID=A0A7J7NBA3_9MAGN|nr:hypothetical protein GIB67_017722 [Kingdonia uniflora]
MNPVMQDDCLDEWPRINRWDKGKRLKNCKDQVAHNLPKSRQQIEFRTLQSINWHPWQRCSHATHVDYTQAQVISLKRVILYEGAHFRGVWYLGERCTKQLIGQYTIPTNPPPTYIDGVPGDFIERLQAADWIYAIPFAFQGFTESNYTLFWRTVTLGYQILEFFHAVNTDEVGPVGYTDRFHVPRPPQTGHHPGTYKITPYTRSIGLRDWYIDVAIPPRPRRQRLTIPAVDPSSLVDAGVLVPDDVTHAKSYMQQLFLDFGLANYFNPNHKRLLTSRVETLWYRAPKLLLGATDYGVGIDLWSVGCLMAEMFAGGLLCLAEQSCVDFPSSSFGLLTMLLALDPSYRGTASSALHNEFFTASPKACDLSGLPVIYKEDEEPDHTSDRKNLKFVGNNAQLIKVSLFHHWQRSSKLKQRSRTHNKKDSATEKSKGDSGSSKEVLFIICKNHNSCTLSINIASVIVLQPNSPQTDGHLNASKNIKNMPTLATTEISTTNYNEAGVKTYRLTRENRSVSTRDFRHVEAKKLPNRYALDDLDD